MEHDSVRVLERAFDILAYLSQAREAKGPTEIASAVGLSKSTVHRLLSSLCSCGYVEKVKEGGSYRIGVKLVDLVSCHINNLELQTEARPYLAALQSELKLVVHLGILDGHEVVYVEKMDISPNLRLYNQIGLRVPAQCSSLGKCLLSRFSGEELAYVMSDCVFTAYTPNSITSLQDLKMHMREVRRQGWAIDYEEYTPGQRCIGAPIYDYRGEIIAAISASGSASALTDDRIQDVVTRVTETAAVISRRLCYHDV